MLDAGSPAPDFSCPGMDGSVRLSDLRGKKVVLYFYPKDMTPGCTIEAENFRDSMPAFEEAGVVVLGVSRDSLDKHCRFRDKHSLNFDLLADEDGTVCEAYDAWQEKQNYGRTYMGIVRSTFLIDEDGKIARTWPQVKVKGHVDEVLSSVNG